MNKILLSIMGMAVAIAGFAVSPEGNLIRDFEFADTANSWASNSKTVRKSEESFQGMPETLYYLSGKGRASLLQKNIPVKANTVYTVSLMYRNDSMPDEHSDYYNLLLGVKPVNGKDWDHISCSTYGASPDWSKARLYFNSGERDKIDLILMFFGTGNWDFGHVVIQEITQRDFVNPVVVDGDFEKGRPGMLASDLRRTGKGMIVPAVAEDPSSGSGKQILRASITGPCALLGNNFIVGPGDRVKVAIRVKSKLPAQMVMGISGVDLKFRPVAGVKSGNRWSLLEIDTLVPENFTGARILNTSISIESTGDNDVFFDNYSVQVVPKDKMTGKTGKNLVKCNPSFEAGTDGWYWCFYEDPRLHSGGGKVSIDSASAGSGNCSLKIEKPDLKGQSRNQFVLRTPMLDIPMHRPCTVSFMARSDIPTEVTIGLVYDSAGNFKLGREWKRYSGTVTPKKNYVSDATNFISLTSPLDGAVISLDSFQVEDGDKLTDFEPSGMFETGSYVPDSIYKIFLTNDKITVRTHAISYGKIRQTIVCDCEVKDYLGKTVSNDSRMLTMEPGKTLIFDHDMQSKINGYFTVNTRLSDANGKILADSVFSYSVMEPPRAVAPEMSWFGILGGDLNCGRRGAPDVYQILNGGTYDEILDVYKKCGFKWLRLMPPGDWNNIEGEKGKYEWKWDAIFERIKKLGFKTHVEFMSYKDYPAWSDSGEKLASKANVDFASKPEDAAAFAAAFASHYKDKVDAVTLLSETGAYTVEEYINIAKAVYPEFKRCAPSITVLMPGYPSNNLPFPDGPDDTWITRILKKGLTKHADAIDIHPYMPGHSGTFSLISKIPFEANAEGRWGTRVEMLELQIKKFRNDYGDIPVWDTESGTIFNSSAPWMRSPLEECAEWYTPEVALGRAVRWGIIRMALGIRRHLYFMFKLGLPYHCLDLVNNDMTPRAGLPALAQFARMLDGGIFVKKIVLGADTWIYLFNVEGRSVAAYWNFNLENKGSATLALPEDIGEYAVYDVMGNRIDSKNGGVRLDSTPNYMVSETAPETFAGILEKAAVTGTADAELRVGFGNTVNGVPSVFVGIRNLMNREMKDEKVQIKSAGLIVIENEVLVHDLKSFSVATLSLPSIIEKGNQASISALMKLNGKNYGDQLDVPGLEIPRTKTEPVADGDITACEYGNTPVIRLADQKRPDYSAELFTAWNEGMLCFAAKVKDPSLIPASADADIYRGDSIELYFDFAPPQSLFAKAWHKDSLRLTVAPTEPVRIVFDRDGTPHKINDFEFFDFNAISSAFRKTDDGYVIEVIIPFKKRLFKDQLFGFELQCINNGNRDRKDNCSLSWTGKKCWNNIRNFGFAILRENQFSQ